MNPVIRMRRSAVANAVPTADLLVEGQLAANTADRLFYILDASGNVINMGGSGQTHTFTGDVTGEGTDSIALTLADSGVVAGSYDLVTVNEKGLITHGTSSYYAVDLTTTDSNQIIDTFDITLVRSARYEMQMEMGTFVHVCEIRVVHNGTTPQFVEYGELYSDSILATFDVSITDNLLSLTASPINTNTFFKFKRSILII